jgi:hypothetical protein
LNDVVLLWSLRCVNLNAFWSRKLNTVAHSLRKVNRILQVGVELRVDNPPLSLAKLWPVKDKINATGAAVILRYSVDPYKMEETVQFEIVRKMKLDMVNMAHAVAGSGDKPTIGGSEGRKCMVTGDCVFHDWFDHFMRGIHSHMGDNVQQDLGLTVDIMVKHGAV